MICRSCENLLKYKKTLPEQWDTCNVKYMNTKESKKFGFAHKIKIDAKRGQKFCKDKNSTH